MPNESFSISTEGAGPDAWRHESAGDPEQWTIGPVRCEAADHGPIVPPVRSQRVERLVAFRLREEVLEGFDDQAGVAVDLFSDSQDWDLSVGQVEGVFEQGTGHHCWDRNEGVWDLLEFQSQASFQRERRSVVAL